MAIDRETKNFKIGTVNSLEPESIPDGAASDSLNWLTKGDRIELVPGYSIVGDDDETDGRVSGLHVAERPDGTLIPFKSHGRKIKTYDAENDEWAEIGSDAIPAAAEDDDISMSDYSPPAGNQLWLNSPNLGPQKVMVATPSALIDQYDSSKNFKGRMRVKDARSLLWYRNEDKTGVYGSWVDARNYTTVTAESIGTGDGVDKTFSGTLAFKGGGAKRTCFGVEITDGVETFTDDFNGNLVGSAGGTGTIDYGTGAYAVEFEAAPANAAPLTADYQWEDATDEGVADFSKSTPRQAGQGFVFPQDAGGGPIQAALSFNLVDYCLHLRKTWALFLSDDDTDATNNVFREKVGIPNHRAACATDRGIYAIDTSDPEDPKFVLITLERGSTEVVPIDISEKLNLTDFRFDKGVVGKEGNLVLFAGRHKSSVENDTLWVLDTRFGSYDRIRRHVACFGNQTYDGEILVGDSLSNNVLKLFDGWSNDGVLAENYWIGRLTDHEIRELKKTRRLVVEGQIGPDQVIQVDADMGTGEFVNVGEIRGNGPYVDAAKDGTIGSPEIGEYQIGGAALGSTPRGRYVRELRFRLGKYRRVRLRFRATGIGYASVSYYAHKDITRFEDRVPKKYRSNV